MQSHFAPAHRATAEEIQSQIERLSNNALMDGLLSAASGLLAVLNEQRQVLAVNESMLAWLGVGDARKILGLRPGEVIQCVHADDSPGGCGTGRFCSTCGAAIAIVTSLTDRMPAERDCAVTVEKKGRLTDLFLRVQCSPIEFEGARFLLLFLHDMTQQQEAAAVERAFFHDIANTIAGLSATSERLVDGQGPKQRLLARRVVSLSQRLAHEVKVQRCITQPEMYPYQRAPQCVSAAQVAEELELAMEDHPAAAGKRLAIAKPLPRVRFVVDMALLMRVLCNMLINAFEATPPKGTVKLKIERASKQSLAFGVWNAQAIVPEIARRIFQRNFSTKQQFGRGLGTYSMKLLGEQLLRGSVSFTSTEAEGTTFRFALPV